MAIANLSSDASMQTPVAMKKLAIRGAAWTFGAYGASQVLRLGGNLILSRLLAPDAFGLMSLVFVFMQGLQMFSDVGIGPSIIQNKRGAEKTFLNTAWTIQVVRGMLLAIAACILATPYALFYGHRELAVLITVASINALLSGFFSTRLASHNRKLSVGRLALIDLASQVFSIFIMLSWVLVSPTVWALVAGGIAGTAAKLLLSHTALPGEANQFAWDAGARRELFQFGRWIFISTALTFVAAQADRLVFGSIASLETLGIYAVALTLSSVPTQVIQRIGSSVLFPIYSRIWNSGQPLSRRLDRARRPLMIAAGTVLATLIAVGPQVIGLLYDDRYLDAGWMLQLLALGCWFQCLGFTSSAALLAIGQSKVSATANLGKFATFVIAVPVGFAMWGFPGAVSATVLGEVAKYAVFGVYAQRNDLRVARLDLRLSIQFCIAVGASWWLVGAMESRGAHPLAVAMAAGAVTSCVWLPAVMQAVSEQRGGFVGSLPRRLRGFAAFRCRGVPIDRT